MSKNVNVNGVDYSGVSQIQLKTTAGGTALFKDVDEIITPSGSVTITENGTHNVSAYAQAVVNVTGESEGETYADLCRNVIQGTTSGAVVLPPNTTKIANNVFYNSTMTSIEMPNVEMIGATAFQYCQQLVLTELPQGLTHIGRQAFGMCNKLAITEIPASVIQIDGEAFSGCAGITTLTFKGTPNTLNTTALYNMKNLTTINVPWAEGAVANAPWGATNATINYNYTGA
jgi:hypothetical protein